ncbi:phosphoadenosine phosphosulfate reductase family protein [Niabella beijingensis]|uniref:phosphoadenosine phosphosulfate reductase domain-containing protein n=1 Tax=Niabella beijingensis TaxID=2872700 RepID=UPI001CBC0014|nr:phosphoadenosine phosphosulfate reductase family protein [Niabella beijingensis]MBZ4188937.1 phosphoadenosine phosphosulfate reductase family protein [Niabella beijingensis]
MSEIITNAIREYSPKRILLLFSGGHDSLCSTHYSATFLKSLGLDFTVYHGNTGIGIRQSRDYVRRTCMEQDWKLYEGYAGDAYEKLVSKYGFPGPQSHKFMYITLKERPLKKYITHFCKSSPYARENILLITGIRKSESRIRMGYRDFIKKEGSAVWLSPIFYWTESDSEIYMRQNELLRNPVKDKICISGECLCGAFAGNEEWAEIRHSFPEAALEIERLHKIAIQNGKPWGWASSPTKYYKHNPQGQMKMFMCIGCEEKKQQRRETISNINTI